MSCREWHDRLQAYVDAELPPHDMEAFRAHTAACHECASAALVVMEAKSAVRRAGQRYAAPADLRTRVMHNTGARSALAAMPTSPPATGTAWPRLAMAAAALFLVATGLFILTNRAQRPDALAEFADLHVATLASANPVDVISTDRHTVKPWFQGRIPFSFDLPELQGSPFVLTGGRVTYFHQEPGAHLIFSYQKHFISAFIFRDSPQLAIARTSFSGRDTSFNLQTWTQDGLRYVLVSDVNAATLQELSVLLQHRQ